MLEKYQESAIVAAREGANKMGFWTTPDGDPAAVAEQESDGDFVSETEAGVFGVAPAGWGFTPYDPTYPHELYEDFMRANLRTIAQALNVSYHGLTGDLTAVNYSSIRAGTLEDREYWMVVQDWFAANFQRPVYLRWLERALNTSLFDELPRNVDRRSAFERYRLHQWQGRRWAWVDPLKDADAAIKLIAAGLKSPQQVAAEMGADVADILDEIAQFQQMAQEKGVRETPQTDQGGLSDDTQD
jgi:lambda family phage portal protein